MFAIKQQEKTINNNIKVVSFTLFIYFYFFLWRGGEGVFGEWKHTWASTIFMSLAQRASAEKFKFPTLDNPKIFLLIEHPFGIICFIRICTTIKVQRHNDIDQMIRSTHQTRMFCTNETKKELHHLSLLIALSKCFCASKPEVWVHDKIQSINN